MDDEQTPPPDAPTPDVRRAGRQKAAALLIVVAIAVVGGGVLLGEMLGGKPPVAPSLESGSYAFSAPENVANDCESMTLFPFGSETVPVAVSAERITIGGSHMKRAGKTFAMTVESEEQLAAGCTIKEEQAVTGEIGSPTEISMRIERRFRALPGQCIGAPVKVPCTYSATTVGTLR